MTMSLDPNEPMTNYVMTEKQYNKLNGYQLHKGIFFRETHF